MIVRQKGKRDLKKSDLKNRVSALVWPEKCISSQDRLAAGYWGKLEFEIP